MEKLDKLKNQDSGQNWNAGQNCKYDKNENWTKWKSLTACMDEIGKNWR